MDELVRRVHWRGIDPPGAERCDPRRAPGGWSIAGVVLAAMAGEPALVRYALALDANWFTRDVEVALWFGGDETARRLRQTVDAAQRWTIARDSTPFPDDHAAADAVRGAIDVDLGCSPATNTLPIRRLALGVGEAADVTAVWVRFPELTVEPLPQRYTRLDERRYRYESAGGEFITEIAVDDLGLVVDYAGGRERVAEVEPGRRSSSPGDP